MHMVTALKTNSNKQLPVNMTGHVGGDGIPQHCWFIS